MSSSQDPRRDPFTPPPRNARNSVSESRPRNRGDTTPASRRERIRSAHACEPCRRRRAKCNGVKPRCARCEELNITCLYADSKADRHQKEKHLSSRALTYEALLQSILPKQDEATQKLIRSTISEDSHPRPDSHTSSAETGDVYDENTAGADAGSPKQQSTTSDISRSEGYIGKSSAVRWLSDMSEKANQEAAATNSSHLADDTRQDFAGVLLEAATYHEIEFEDQMFADLNQNIDLKVLPPKWQADQFVKAYMATVQPFFQVVEKEQFLKQYEFFWSTGVPPEGGALWQAMLNLILGIGCLHAKFSGTYTNGTEDVHCFLRARMLSLEPLNLLQLPQRAHVQLTAAFAMYLLSCNRINRAWLMNGTSVRYAENLGYHLHNVDDKISAFDKELNKRLWFSVSSLEHVLCFLTGRAMFIRDSTTSVQLPKSLGRSRSSKERTPSIDSRPPQHDAEQSESLEVFRREILLDRILAETIFELYTAATVRKSWAQLQQRVASLNIKLSTWKAYLPDRFGMKDLEAGEQPDFTIDAVYLSLRYFSVSILINRPSLCYHHENMREKMPDQSDNSRAIDVDNAKRAIDSARGMLQLLNRHSHQQLYNQSPWWCLLHFVVQACALLVMEFYDQSQHTPEEERQDFLRDTKCGMDILYSMRENNPAAEKAYRTLQKLIQVALPNSQLKNHTGVAPSTQASTGPPGTAPSYPRSTQASRSAFSMLQAPTLTGSIPILSPFVNFTPSPDGDVLTSPDSGFSMAEYGLHDHWRMEV